jgi:hypothetical protein
MKGVNWATLIRKWAAALAIFAMLAGGVSLASIVFFGDRSKPAPQPTAAPRTTLTPPLPSVPTAAEFTIGVVVTGQNCPLSGMCVYKYTIEPKYVGLHPLPETPFTVVYEVTGGQQPQNGDFTVHNGQAQIMKDVVLEGPPGARLQAAVTQVQG